MFPTVYPRRMATGASNSEPTPAIIDVSSRGLFPDLSRDPLQYAHGLTGVDQKGNYLWVNVIGLCFLVLLLGVLILRIAKALIAQMRHMASIGNPAQQAYWAENHTQWWPWLKRHLFYAPLFKKRHNQPFQLSSAITNGTLPGRFQTLVLVVYVASNIAYCLVLPWGNPEPHSVVAALRGRSGTLAALNLVPTILFALRNNPLIPLLRVSYDDFNLLHRWAARIVIIESIVHTSAWFYNTVSIGHLKLVGEVLRKEESYAWGAVGTAIFTFIAVQACAPVRHAFYETFLNVHRIMVLLALVAVYIHIDTHRLPQLPWIRIVFILWGLEWFFRVVRICWFNLSRNRGVTRIHVEALPGEACRVTFTLARPWHPIPGCHVHMYMPTFAWHSSHPFSIAWADMADNEHATLPITEKGGLALPNPTPKTRTISLVCRARTGFTRKMYLYASEQPQHQFSTWGLAEGPYGGHHSLDSYGTVLLFAGGVGITHQVMYANHLVSSHAQGKAAIRKLLLVWTVPSTECLDWVRPWMNHILALPGRRDVLRIMLFVTKPNRQDRFMSGSGGVQMIPGRPNIKTIVDQEIRERVGAMAVQVCGSGGFADSIRQAVRTRVEVGVVDFIEEAFTY